MPLKRNRLTIAQLRAIDAVVRHDGFSEAAKALGVSQPTISNLVRAVEHGYKTALLRRDGYTLSPSNTLYELLPSIRAIIALFDELEERLVDERDLDTGEIRIAYSTYQLALPILTQYKTKFPKIKLVTRALASGDIMALLENGDIDVGFITAQNIPTGYDGKQIVSSRIGLIVPKKHTLATRMRIEWSDLRNIDLLQREKTSGTRRIFESAAKLANHQFNTIFSVGSWGSIVDLIHQGFGLGIGLEHEVRVRDEVIAIPINAPELRAGHFMIYPEGLHFIERIKAFSHFIDMADMS